MKQDYLRAAAFTRLVLRRKAARTDDTDDSGGGGDTTGDDDSDATVGAGATAGAETPPAADGPVQTDLFSEPTSVADTDHEAPTDAAGDAASTADGPADTTTSDPDNVTGLEITDYDNTCDMIVVIDLATLLGGLHEHSIIDNGTPHDIPVESYRRMACQAAIIPIVLNSDGVCLDLGRGARLANRAQRRALIAMYTTCSIPDCRVSSRHCQPHHVIWSTRLGDTDLDNLLPLCSKHHHAAHEGGWQLDLHPNRSLTITYPDGRTQDTGPPATYQRVRDGRGPTRPTSTGPPDRKDAA